MTSLHQACINGNLDIVKLLIDCGSQIDLKDLNGYTPLHYACQHLKLDIVALFLAYGINPNEATFKNETPLHIVIQLAPLNSINNLAEKIILQLLSHGAFFSLAVSNNSHQTPFELACELGKLNIIETILKFCLSSRNESKDKLSLIRNYSKKSLILASKNAHDDIIRLLLVYKLADLNYTTQDGSALHDACRYGRFQTVKLLLESGLDQNLKSSSNQLASDVVIKQKIGNDIKCLLKEYSQSLRALSIKPHTSNHSGSLNFDSNELITVLDRSNQNWRGFILDRSNYTTRSGYFPSNHVQILNDQDYKCFYSPAKTRPFITSSTNSLLKLTEADNLSLNETCNFDFKDSIYMSNSQLDKIQKNQLIKISNLSPSSSSSVSSSSSSSYNNRRKASCLETSLDRVDYSDTDIYASGANSRNVGEMLRSGMTDSQIIFNWLKEFGLEQYYENFLKAGYDLITIMKCCPADLCAIGVSDPSHRQFLKHAISLLDISEIEARLDEYLCQLDSIDDLLKLIHLEQYTSSLKQIYKNFSEFVNTLSWEDLEEIGVKKLGHQKKFIFVTKKLKEIMSSKLLGLDRKQEQKPFVQLNNLTKSLENLALEQKMMNRPALPKRVNTFNRDGAGPKQHPPLPPRISSVVLPQDLVSSYATLPRNKKNSVRVNNFNENNRAESSSSSSPPVSSASSSPSLTSPVGNGKFIDANSILVPPTPPPMPLMSIPSHDANSYRKSPRRALNLSTDTCLEDSYKKINSNFTLSSVLNHRPIGLNKNQLIANNNSTCNNSNNSSVNKNDKSVLNDIDSMLCDLNKQLDAMLDYEKVFKD